MPIALALINMAGFLGNRDIILNNTSVDTSDYYDFDSYVDIPSSIIY